MAKIKTPVLPKPDKSWTLFLDRDGVINRRPMNDYVKTWKQFEFLPGVLEAISKLTSVFGRIIVVTNQQGIGKNLMSSDSLEKIHELMKKQVEQSGGMINAIYFCPDLATKPVNCRKPDTRMAAIAQKDFPDINFTKSIMAGDTASDLTFGQNARMKSVYINTNDVALDESLYIADFPDLISFADACLQTID